jgi:hypothetical protein
MLLRCSIGLGETLVNSGKPKSEKYPVPLRWWGQTAEFGAKVSFKPLITLTNIQFMGTVVKALSNAFLVLICLAMAPRGGAADASPDEAAVRAARILETRYERLASAGESPFVPQRIENPYAVWPEVELLVTLQFGTGSHAVDPGSSVTVALPHGLLYVPGSAVGPGTGVWVSDDGGIEFVEEQQRRKSTPGATGIGLTGADGPRVTHLRWTFPYPLEPGVNGFLRYRVLRDRSLAPANPELDERPEADAPASAPLSAGQADLGQAADLGDAKAPEAEPGQGAGAEEDGEPAESSAGQARE